jgi:hypothetical protein
LVQLSIDSQRLESFSLEHEDPARIIDALNELALDSRASTNYQAGLRAALGLAKSV